MHLLPCEQWFLQAGRYGRNHGRNHCSQGMHLLLLISKNILGDPGADKGGEGKSKRAEKYIWNALLAVLYFSSCHIFPPFSLSLVPTTFPWVSEDDQKTEQKFRRWKQELNKV